MGKQILFDKEAIPSLRIGVNKVADIIGSTMGACGRTVFIAERPRFTKDGRVEAFPPRVTKDGQTVASSIVLDDELENIGAQIIRGASETTMLDAGDGTTQTAVLAQSLINQGLDAVAAGKNPQEVKFGMDEAVNAIVEELKRMSIDVGENNDRIRSIATISANNDVVIGNLIGDAYEKIGKDGLLLIENSGTIETKIEVVEGYEMGRGYISPEFANDEKKRASHKDALILVADYSIKNMREIFPILKQLDDSKLLSTHPLIIVAQDFEGEVYSSMLINHKNGAIQCCLVKAPSTYRKEHMEDLAVMTGATVIRDENGLKLEGALLSHLGSAEKITISEYTTTVIGGGGKKEKVEDLKKTVKAQLEEIKDEQLKPVWEKRLAKISGSIAIIKVGGATDIEQKEKVDRVDDACRAVKSAIEEGIVAGGGEALIRCEAIPMNLLDLNESQLAGATIVRNACYAPLEKMLENAGMKSKDIILDVRDGAQGYNIKTRKFENLIESGIIDPTKVIRCALQNAASVAGAVITSRGFVVDMPKKN